MVAAKRANVRVVTIVDQVSPDAQVVLRWRRPKGDPM